MDAPSVFANSPGAGRYQARALLSMCHRGLKDMEASESDRVRLGFCGLVVFGRSVTLAMETMSSVEGMGFDEWYAPWRQEMKTDPLLRFFNQLRRDIIHLTPSIGVLMNGFGPGVGRPGTIRVDRPLPETHRGEPISDQSMENLCRLYIDYLEEMFASLAPLVWPAEDRWMAALIAEPNR